MNKTIHLVIFTFIILFGSCNKNPSSSDQLIDIEDIYIKVLDISKSNNKYILIDSSFTNYEIVENGKLRLLNENSPKYFYDIKSKRSISGNFDFQKYSYLCSSDECYYACFFDWSYSSHFVKLNFNTYEEEFFRYIQGVPSGLYFYDDKLWYIGGTGNGGLQAHSILHCFDVDINDEILSIEMDNINAKGLYINDEDFIVFDRNSKSFLSFIIDYNSNSIILRSDNP